MDIEEFQNLPNSEVAKIVRSKGPKVCVFPLNGTRRWVMLEHPASAQADSTDNYLEIMTHAYLRIFRLFFEHGVEVMLSPMISTGILERGPAYLEMVPRGFAKLVNHPDFLALCKKYQVQVRLYGDYQRTLANTPYEYLEKTFDELSQTLAEQTSSHQKHRLLFGIFADDAVEALAGLTIDFYQKQNKIPDKQDLIMAYYGEYLSNIDMYIGFGKFAVFGLPLVATNKMALYFTVSPSPYLTERPFRTILYDYIYTRQKSSDYIQMEPDDWEFMADFYRKNRDIIIGTGKKSQTGDVWYPLPRVVWPSRRTGNSKDSDDKKFS